VKFVRVQNETFGQLLEGFFDGDLAQVPVLSHRMYQLNGFGKSAPPQIVELLFSITSPKNKLTMLWGISLSKANG
jgi:hypothetical protein